MDIFSVASTYLTNRVSASRGGILFRRRRDFRQLHFGHYKCQSLSSQRSPGEFLKRLQVADSLSIPHSGAASYGGNICRARRGGRLAACSLVSLVIKDEDLEIGRRMLMRGWSKPKAT